MKFVLSLLFADLEESGNNGTARQTLVGEGRSFTYPARSLRRYQTYQVRLNFGIDA